MQNLKAKVAALNQLNALILTHAPTIYNTLESFAGKKVVLTDGQTLTAPARTAFAPIFEAIRTTHDHQAAFFDFSTYSVWVKFRTNYKDENGTYHQSERSVFFGRKEDGYFEGDRAAFDTWINDCKQYTPEEIHQARQAYEQKAQEAQEIFNSIPRELREYLPTIGR